MMSHINQLFLKLYVLLIILNFQQNYWVLGEPQVPCYFIFGDSLSDNGNNNNLSTSAKANYEPYGNDFPIGPTGRFTNRRNLADFIAELLGFDNYIPPFKTAKGREILRGVNYASGSAGIRDESGSALGERISFNNQLKNHLNTVSQINRLLRNSKEADAYLKRCIYTVAIGSNDYLNNYFMPQFYRSSDLFNPQQYARLLIKDFSRQLKILYKQGGRKVAIFGVGLIGCTPYARANFDTKGSPCVQSINDAIQLFNVEIKPLVDDFNTKLPNAKFIFIDSVQISITGTSNQGQVITDTPCCEVAAGEGELQCVPFGKVCDDRNQYIFWDKVHPTDTGFQPTASRAYNAQFPNDTYPYDINHLANL